MAVILVVPKRGRRDACPTLAVTTVLLSPARRLPNWSSIRITGCGAKAAPAVAVGEGCVRIVRRLAAAGLTKILDEVTEGTEGTEGTLKAKFMVSAVL